MTLNYGWLKAVDALLYTRCPVTINKYKSVFLFAVSPPCEEYNHLFPNRLHRLIDLMSVNELGNQYLNKHSHDHMS